MGSEIFVEFLEDCTVPQDIIINHNQDKFTETESVQQLNLKCDLQKNLKPIDEFGNDRSLKLKHYRGKCAEVFIENGECYVVCEFCDINFKNLEVFLCHIYKRHLIMKNPLHEQFSKQEDQLVSNQTEEQDKLKAKIKCKKLKNYNKKSSPQQQIIINIDDKEEIVGQNIVEVIEEDDSNNSDSCPTQQYFNNVKAITTNSEIQNSKLVCLLDDHEIDFNEFAMNPQDRNDAFHQLNINSSSITDDAEDSANYESLFRCDICSEILTNLKDYKQHSEKHQNEWESYVCPLCPKSFGSSFLHENEFNLHMRKHLQQQNQKDFHCQYCDDIFLKQVDLLRHVEIHHSSLFLQEEHENIDSGELFGDALDSI